MAGNQALAAVGRSIVDLLNRRIVEAIPVPPRPTAVMAGTTDFDEVNASPVAVISYPAHLPVLLPDQRRPRDTTRMVGGLAP